MKTEQEQFYTNLIQRLKESSDWPNEYIFKFIIPTDQSKLEKLLGIFDNTGAIINTKTSSKGKFTSVSLKLYLHNPEEVVEKYIIVGNEIEGVISL